MSLSVSYNSQSLIHLPTDVLLTIVGKLGLRNVVILSKVCKRLASVANSDKIWENLFVNFFSRIEFVNFEKNFICRQIPTNKIKFKAVYNIRKGNRVTEQPRPPAPGILKQIASNTKDPFGGSLLICLTEIVSLGVLGIAEYKKYANGSFEKQILQLIALSLPLCACLRLDENIRFQAISGGTHITGGLALAALAVAIPVYVLYKTIAGIVYAILFIIKN